MAFDAKSGVHRHDLQLRRCSTLDEEKQNRRWTCLPNSPATMDDNAFRFGTLTQQVKGWLRVSSPLKKAPGERTGPTIHVDFRGNLVGRVPSRGEQDDFEQAVSRFLSASIVVYLRFNCRFRAHGFGFTKP